MPVASPEASDCGDAVDYIKRVAACGDGARAAHFHRCAAAGDAGALRDLHAGHAACEGLLDAVGGHVGEVGAFDGRNRGGDVAFALHAVAHHYHFFKGVGRGVESHFQRRVVLYRDIGGLISYIGNG